MNTRNKDKESIGFDLWMGCLADIMDTDVDILMHAEDDYREMYDEGYTPLETAQEEWWSAI